MERKIRFDLTIGSYWPEKRTNPVELVFPTGGERQLKDVVFETDNVTPLDDAIDALEKEIGDQSYHIWYWYWIE